VNIMENVILLASKVWNSSPCKRHTFYVCHKPSTILLLRWGFQPVNGRVVVTSINVVKMYPVNPLLVTLPQVWSFPSRRTWINLRKTNDWIKSKKSLLETADFLGGKKNHFILRLLVKEHWQNHLVYNLLS